MSPGLYQNNNCLKCHSDIYLFYLRDDFRINAIKFGRANQIRSHTYISLILNGI